MTYHLTRRWFLTMSVGAALSSLLRSDEMFPQPFWEGVHKAIATPATLVIHSSVGKSAPPPDYRSYVQTLEMLLSNAKLEDASRLIELAPMVVVPLTQAVFHELTRSFNHYHEVSYLLFATRDGTIDTLVEPPQQAYQFEGRAAVHIRFSDEDISPFEKKGKVFVGDYHSHRRTKEEILALKKDQAEQAKDLLTRHSHAKYELWDNTTPSSGDLEGRFKSLECTSREDCHLMQRLRQQQKVTLIGGLNTDTFQFEIRAFNYLTYEKPQLELTEQGHRAAQQLNQRYRATHGKYLEYVEFHLTVQ